MASVVASHLFPCNPLHSLLSSAQLKSTYVGKICPHHKNPLDRQKPLPEIGKGLSEPCAILLANSLYYALFSFTAACAAAKRAIGTRNGEQET